MHAIREFNFDGLIGPTHNYAGLSYGNIASAKHRQKGGLNFCENWGISDPTSS